MSASIKTRADKQFAPRSSTPWTETRTKKYTACKRIWKARGRKDFKFCQTRNGCIICLDTIPSKTEQVLKPGFAVQWHTTSKRTPVTTSWSQTKSTSHAKVLNKETLQEETLCATDVPHKSWYLTSPAKENWKHQIQMLCRLAMPKSNGDRDRVIAATRETSRFGQGINAESFDSHRNVRKQQLEYLRRARKKMRSWSRRLSRAKASAERRICYYEFPNSPRSIPDAPITLESDEDDADCALPDRVQQVPDHDSNTTHYGLERMLLSADAGLFSR